MKCPSCSAECSDQARACEFCGYVFVDAGEQAAAPPPAPPASAAPPQAPAPPPVVEPVAPVSPPPASPYQNVTQATRESDNVPNYMIWAIVSTVIATIVTMFTCCCLPLGLPSGIAAIVYALKVNKHSEAGDITGAWQASKTAKMWCWVTTALAIIFGILFIISLAMNLLGYSDPNFLEDLRKQMEAAR